MINHWKENYYKVLQLDRHASFEQIKEARKRLIRYYHVDNGNISKETSEAMTKLINEAYTVLSDKTGKKDEYDRWLDETIKTQATTTKSASTSTEIVPVNNDMIDYYNALNIRRNADQKAIKDAYFKALKVLQSQLAAGQTDKIGGVVALVEEAYRILSNPETKKRYDESYDKRMGVYVPPKTEVVKKDVKKAATPTPRVENKPQKKKTTTEQGDNPKNLITYINKALLKEVSRTPFFGGYATISDVWVILGEDGSVQLMGEAREEEHDARIIRELCWLYNGPEKVSPKYAIQNAPWRNYKLINVFGVKSIAIPVIKFVPAGFTHMQNMISYADLRTVRNLIIEALIEYPSLLDSYFGKPKTDASGGKKK